MPSHYIIGCFKQCSVHSNIHHRGEERNKTNICQANYIDQM